MVWKWAGVWVLVLAAATALAGEHPEIRYTRGLAAFQAGQYAEAINAFDEVLRDDPKHVGAKYYRALAKAKQGQLAEAIRDLEESTKAGAGVSAAPSLGMAYFEAGKRAEAQRWLQRAVAEPASAAPAHLLLGIIAYEEGRVREAEKHFASADADGNARLKGSAAYYLGLIALKESRLADARTAFTRAQATGEPAIAQAASNYLQSLGAQPAPAPKRAPAPVAAPRALSLRALAGFEYDSNLVLADIPASQLQSIGVGKKNDGRFVLGAGGTYHALAESQIRLDVSYDLYQSIHFDVTKLDLQGHTVRATAEFGDGMVVPGIDASYSFYFIDHDRTYLQELLGSPYVVVDESDIGQVEVYGTIRGRDYLGKPFNPGRDATNYAGGLRQTFFLGAADRTLDIGYQFDREDPQSNISGRDFDYQGHQIDAGVQAVLPLPTSVNVELRYGYRNEDYSHGNSRNPAQQVTLPDRTSTQSRLRRRDDAHWFSLGVTGDINEHLYARLGYWGRMNDSNTPIFEYDRHIVSATLGVRF